MSFVKGNRYGPRFYKLLVREYIKAGKVRRQLIREYKRRYNA
jgi:hypothetical protein